MISWKTNNLKSSMIIGITLNDTYNHSGFQPANPSMILVSEACARLDNDQKSSMITAVGQTDGYNHSGFQNGASVEGKHFKLISSINDNGKSYVVQKSETGGLLTVVFLPGRVITRFY